ncbi:hypothetical protein ACTA71_003190 [Dictyostelium dimigraforme]
MMIPIIRFNSAFVSPFPKIHLILSSLQKIPTYSEDSSMVFVENLDTICLHARYQQLMLIYLLPVGPQLLQTHNQDATITPRGNFKSVTTTASKTVSKTASKTSIKVASKQHQQQHRDRINYNNSSVKNNTMATSTTKQKQHYFGVQIPMYGYGYNGDKFKSAQVPCLETTKLKLSLKEKLELKCLLVGEQEKLKRLKERNSNNKTIDIVNSNNSDKTINNVSNNNGSSNKDSSNNRIFNKVNNDKVTGIVNSGNNKNITIGNNNNKNNMVETVTRIDNRVTEIIVVEIPETFAPVRRGFDMEIKIIHDSKPIKRNYGRRLPEEFRLIVEEAVRLFKLDIIEESVSDYSSIPFLQKTKTERTKNAKWFSKADCKSGFHLLNLEEGRQYTAFRVGNKIYQFKRCIFGLKNSPAYPKRWTRSIIDEFDSFTLAYVDDMVIFSHTFKDHILHLNIVLNRLKANKIF